ncbi:MAG: CvpA family protein [Planctomycetaceae bacterium]|jgi:uncharacterized membrane protein required for colicin V production|nr:CvpA family protein [Planctomycetaceae bacterium]
MTLFDIIILLILFIFAIRGLALGMISQIISVGSYILCWVVSTRFSFLVAPSIPAQPPWDNIGAIIILFIVTMIAIRFVHSMIRKLIEKFRLVKYDRILGLLLGAVKGLILCMVITFFAAMLCEKSRQMVLVSKSGNMISQLIVRVGCFIPEDSGKMLKTQIELFNGQVDGQFQEAEDFNLQLPDVSFEKILDNVKDIRGKVESNIESGKNAVSLIDGINKWWNEWWNGNSNSNSVGSENEPESKPESKINPIETDNNNDIFNDSNSNSNNNLQNKNSVAVPIVATGAESEKQIWMRESAPRTDSVQDVVRNVSDQVSTDTDSEQLLIPRNRGLFRLSRSPVQPSEFNRSQNKTQNNQSAKLFGQ